MIMNLNGALKTMSLMNLSLVHLTAQVSRIAVGPTKPLVFAVRPAQPLPLGFTHGPAQPQGDDDDDAGPLAAQPHTCGKCIIGATAGRYICSECRRNNSDRQYSCRTCTTGTTDAAPFTCSQCTNNNPDITSSDCAPRSMSEETHSRHM